METQETVQEAVPARAEDSAFRLLLAVTVMAAVVAITLLLVSTRHYLIPVARTLAAHGWVKDRTTMDMVLTLGLLAPSALLVGLLCGRRYRWVPTAPVGLWLVYCWGTSLKLRQLFPMADLREQLRFALLWPLAAALAFYLLAVVGARLARAGAVRAVLALLLGAGYVWLGALGASLATMDTLQLLATVAVGSAVITVLVVTAYGERRIARQTARFLLGVLCGVSIFFDLIVVATMGGLLTKDVPGLIAAIAALAMLIVLVALIVRYRRPEASTANG